eukprot:CAMPEP_0198498572 /NCGR_PEP_ID=MMETSP1462-20131121/7091_1 /TAXON_ID=1333877 /ORGANISM="Brandtodinium nutriculum, Strain RCC3387" /LENGTH=63 /DNA_ID=CAMNT_0044227495 /DNA_START=111 /DNA_END=298 /DNA_ORIENTATION=+
MCDHRTECCAVPFHDGPLQPQTLAPGGCGHGLAGLQAHRPALALLHQQLRGHRDGGAVWRWRA